MSGKNLITQKLTRSIFEGATKSLENQLLSVSGGLSNYNFVTSISPTSQKLRIVDFKGEVMLVDLRIIPAIQTQAEGEEITTVFDDINPTSPEFMKKYGQGSGYSILCVTEKNIFIGFRTTKGYKLVVLQDCQVVFYVDATGKKQKRFFFTGVKTIDNLGNVLDPSDNTLGKESDIDNLGITADATHVYVFTPSQKGSDIFKICINNLSEITPVKLENKAINRIAVGPFVVGDYVYFISGGNGNSNQALHRMNRHTMQVELLANNIQYGTQAMYNTPYIRYHNGCIYAVSMKNIGGNTLSIRVFDLNGTRMLNKLIPMPFFNADDGASGKPKQYVKTFCVYGNKLFVPTWGTSNDGKKNELDLIRINLDTCTIEEHLELSECIFDCYVDPAGNLVTVSVDLDFTNYYGNLGDSEAILTLYNPYKLADEPILKEPLADAAEHGIGCLSDLSSLGVIVPTSGLYKITDDDVTAYGLTDDPVTSITITNVFTNPQIIFYEALKIRVGNGVAYSFEEKELVVSLADLGIEPTEGEEISWLTF